MANKENSIDIIPLREALNMEIMINQALIDILDSKGIVIQRALGKNRGTPKRAS
ncbi:MAG: hypothetical protein WBB19_19900 [Desulforhopalus sp.]